MRPGVNNNVQGGRPQRLRTFWRKHLRRWWNSLKWPVVIGLGIFAVVLGYIGFRKHLPGADNGSLALDIIYRIMQLFVLDSGSMESVQPPIEWELNVARFLAPFVAMYTALQALAVIFSEQIKSLRLLTFKNHYVICGLGQKGLLLAKAFLENGERVVVIEHDRENDNLEFCREQGAILVMGNATEREMLLKAGIIKAGHLISVCGDDGVNAEVAIHVRELIRERKGRVLSCLVHIVDPHLCNLLREREIETKKVDTFRLEFFNVFESGARILLKEFPAFGENDDKADSPHMLVVGLGRMGESLVVQAARGWKDMLGKTGKKLRITIIDKEAELKKESLSMRYTQLEKTCFILPLQLDVRSPEFQRGGFLFDSRGNCDLTSLYVCLSDDSQSLSAALSLHRHLRNLKVSIVVRMAHDAGLATLIRGEDYGGSLYAFGLLDRTCRPDLLLGGTHEVLACAIHEDYVRNQKEKGNTPETNPSMVRWEELPEHIRESNRLQADHIGIKLRAVGCGIAPLTDWDADLFELTKEEVEKLAEMEHERWNAERLDDGWKYGTEKDMQRKISPYLVEWNKLSEDVKEYDRNTVRGTPAFLARAGFQIYRLK